MRKVVLATVMATFCFSSVIASTEYKPIIIDKDRLSEVWTKEATAPIKYISDEYVVYYYYNHPPDYAGDRTLHCAEIETGNDIWKYPSVRHDRLLKYNRYEDMIIAEVMSDEKSYAFSYVALDINNGEEVWRSENEYGCDGNSGSGIYQVVDNSMYFLDLELYSAPGYYYELFLVSMNVASGKERYRFKLCTGNLAIDNDPCGYLSDVSGDLQLWIPTIKFRNLLLFDSKKMKVSQIDGTNESYSSRSNTYNRAYIYYNAVYFCEYRRSNELEYLTEYDLSSKSFSVIDSFYDLLFIRKVNNNLVYLVEVTTLNGDKSMVLKCNDLGSPHTIDYEIPIPYFTIEPHMYCYNCQSVFTAYENNIYFISKTKEGRKVISQFNVVTKELVNLLYVDNSPIEINAYSDYLILTFDEVYGYDYNTICYKLFVDEPTPTPQPDVTTLEFQIDRESYYLNDNIGYMDVSPTVINDRTLLPARYVVEPLGGDVAWDEQEKKVTCILGDVTIEMWIDNPIAKVNGEEVQIDPHNPEVTPTIIDDRTFVPVRFLAENLGCQTQWDAETKKIILTYSP